MSDHKTQKSKHQKPQKQGIASRQAASKLLSAIIDKQVSMDGLLDPKGGNPAFLALNDQDRLLVRAIILTSLRHYRVIEAFFDRLVDNSLPQGAKSLKHILFVAAAQILYLDVPDHSAVDLAVEQANIDPRNRRFAKLVNALLRRMVREKNRRLKKLEAETPNVPQWYFEKLTQDHGEARAMQLSQIMSLPPHIDISVKSDPQEWAERLGGFVLPNGTVRLTKIDGPVQNLDGFDDGEWWVQDAAASIPAKLLGDLSGKSVIDLCAAPGGKTAQLILAGGHVTALDRSKSRLNRLNENLARLKLDATTFLSTMEDYQSDHLFDAALLDAPCSSTGTIRRHPDILWTKSEKDINYLADVQYGLLERAMRLVKSGGFIVFSNCSLEQEEGEDMIARFLDDHPSEIERVVIEPALCPGFEKSITKNGDLRTFPDLIKTDQGAQADGNDGFYACLLRVKRR